MDSKVEFKYGSLRFSAEGDAKWVAGEFQKVINSLGKIATAEPLAAPVAKKRTTRKPVAKATEAKPAAKRRGRPKGSTNKPKTTADKPVETATAAKPAAKRRGRPKGSTNKPKTATAKKAAAKSVAEKPVYFNQRLTDIS